MITVIQRVKKAKVIIDNKIYSEIKNGYLILLGIFEEDTEKEIDKLIEKIINLRIMADENNKMNKSILETKNEIMVVSQFTLCANLKGGRRPDFFPAKEPEEAEKFYNLFIEKFKSHNLSIKSGQFAAYMEVELVNDGPVTFILDSKNL
jgi:D-tyrosyl-tRNA(Tyr) deacylase